MKVLTAKSMAELLRQHSDTASSWAGQTGKHKHSVFPSWLQQLQTATCLLEENVLQFLLYWLSSRVKKVFMICKFWAVKTELYFIRDEIFNGVGRTHRSCCQPKPHQLFYSISLSFIGLWVKIWNRNKRAYSTLNIVQTLQSCRSKLTACLRNRRLLRFE